MKDLYLSMCLLLCCIAASSQNKNNHWQLGPLDFNFSTNPNTISTIGGISDSSNYGYATISDDNGNLLFYTDGIKVWNKNHQVMQNGANLGTGSYVNQRAIIVPHPGNSNIYYIFRQENEMCLCNALSYGHYVYSMVDFSSNSLGSVVVINSTPDSTIGERNVYTKALKDNSNQALKNPYTYSPLTTAKNATDNGYWVIVQNGNRMLSYQINASGFNASPIISTFATGQIYNFGHYNEISGSLEKIQRSMFRIASNTNISKLYGLESSTPETIADPARHTYQFYRLDFNNSTGQFSNYQNISIVGSGISFNFELSPDLQKAYIISYPIPSIGTTQNGQIFVKDLTNLTSTVQPLYEFANPSTLASQFSFIQKDKYDNVLIGSIFSANNRNKYVHIIDNPNSFSGSKVKINQISLNNKVVHNFPQLIPSLNQSCIENITLSTPEASSSTYKASNTITTNGNYTVNGGLNVSLQAQNAIFLEPNTDIKTNSTFTAEIKECTTVVSFEAKAYSSDSSEETYGNIKNGLTLYPNPANNFTTIALTEDTIKNIIITSIDGRVVFNRDIMQKSYELDVSSYSQGIYIVVVSTINKETFTSKLLKK